MTTTAWLHCFSGIAGDMMLGACIDAGADVDKIRGQLDGLDLDDWTLSADSVLRSGLAATHAVVKTTDRGYSRTYAAIRDLLDDADLPERAVGRAQQVFGRLAAAEGRMHHRPPDEVHFHEVGSTDAIVDVVGACLALELLGVDDVVTSPVAIGHGTVKAAHGALPNPAPAVVELLRDVPAEGVDLDVELTTPTGAALVAGLAIAHGPMPAMTVAASGFGAGTTEIVGQPNVLHLVLGTRMPTDGDPAGEPLLTLETNLDDVSGELVARTVAELLEAGALDAWCEATTMKKGRPGVRLAALCREPDASRLREIIGAETGTLGIRATASMRWAADRVEDEVLVDGHPIRVKRAPGRAKPEFDDAVKVAGATGRSVREVLRLAEDAAQGDGGHAGS